MRIDDYIKSTLMYNNPVIPLQSIRDPSELEEYFDEVATRVRILFEEDYMPINEALALCLKQEFGAQHIELIKYRQCVDRLSMLTVDVKEDLEQELRQ